MPKSLPEPADQAQPRYAFVEAGGVIFALQVPDGRKGISCGGILMPAKSPVTADERHAVTRLEKVLAGEPERAEIRRLTDADTVAIMARTIAERARQRSIVERVDFRQAGIPDSEIDSHIDAAMARARRMEPKLDAIGAMP